MGRDDKALHGKKIFVVQHCFFHFHRIEAGGLADGLNVAKLVRVTSNW